MNGALYHYKAGTRFAIIGYQQIRKLSLSLSGPLFLSHLKFAHLFWHQKLITCEGFCNSVTEFTALAGLLRTRRNSDRILHSFISQIWIFRSLVTNTIAKATDWTGGSGAFMIVVEEHQQQQSHTSKSYVLGVPIYSQLATRVHTRRRTWSSRGVTTTSAENAAHEEYYYCTPPLWTRVRSTCTRTKRNGGWMSSWRCCIPTTLLTLYVGTGLAAF